MFEVITFVASSVSDSGLRIAKVLFSHWGKGSCYLKGDKGFETFDVQVELMGKSQREVRGSKLILYRL